MRLQKANQAVRYSSRVCHLLCMPYLCDCVLHDLLVRHIALVADQELVHTFRRVSVDLLQPLLDIVEAVHVRNIVDNANAVCAAVVGRGDGAEALLSSGIPLLRCLVSSSHCIP